MTAQIDPRIICEIFTQSDGSSIVMIAGKPEYKIFCPVKGTYVMKGTNPDEQHLSTKVLESKNMSDAVQEMALIIIEAPTCEIISRQNKLMRCTN